KAMIHTIARGTQTTFAGMNVGNWGDVPKMTELQRSLKTIRNSQVWSPQNATKMFCSYFAVAAYQAVLGTDVKRLLALDAPKTSPMRLESYLKKRSDTWTMVGDYKP
ncbi:MAG: hypothetical protein HON70_00055, partial [Lentisphaerae bacterium]|nr:hypothetical protein [Lentisphaerota bacterium]